MRIAYQPKRKNGKSHSLSPKTLRNISVAFRSFFNWAEEEFDYKNPMTTIKAHKFEKAPVETYIQTEVKNMLKRCKYTNSAKTNGRRSFKMTRMTALRDEAIILLLLDTGLRSMECCALLIGDVELKAVSSRFFASFDHACGKRSGAKRAYTHKFRHTFAANDDSRKNHLEQIIGDQISAGAWQCQPSLQDDGVFP